MANKFRNVGVVESGGAASSYTDTTGAYMDYDGTHANFGAKASGGGTVGVKLRTMVAGVLTLAITLAGTAATFAGNMTQSAGTASLQAVTATSITASSGIGVTGGSAGAVVATLTSFDTGTTTDLLVYQRSGSLVRGVLRFVNTNKFQFGTTTTHVLDILADNNVIGTFSNASGLVMNSYPISGVTTLTTLNTGYPSVTFERDGGAASTRGKAIIGFSNVGYAGGTGADSIVNNQWGFLVQVNNQSAPVSGLLVTNGTSVVCGNAAIATNATDGFLYIPSCAGAPSGVPTAFAGRIPLVYDSTNNFLYVYVGGAWKKSTVYA